MGIATTILGIKSTLISESNPADVDDVWPCLTLPGLGAVQGGGNQVSPAVPVEDQGLATGQHPAAEADLRPPQGGEAVVGGEARAGEALRQEGREGLGGQLTRRAAEPGVTSGGGGAQEEEELTLGG